MKDSRVIVEAGVMIALAQVLSYVKVYESPYGGSVTAASMLPILFFALHRGLKPGLMAGTVYGVLQFLLGPKWSFHVLSIALDYVVAFGALGFAGVFVGKGLRGARLGTLLGIGLRFLSHFVAGVVIWGIYAPEGMNPWLYSLVYQGSYLLPELLLTLLVMSLVWKPVSRALENI